MRRAPTTEGSTDATASTPVRVDAGPAERDDALGVYTLFFSVPRREVAYFKIVVEAGDGYGVSRTMEKHHGGDPSRALVVVLAVPGFLEPCVHMLARLCEETGSTQVRSTPELREALAAALPPGD